MNFAHLKTLLTLQKPLRTLDSIGGYTTIWKDVGQLWAAVVPIRVYYSQEQLLTQQMVAVTHYRIQMRYTPNISHEMRLIGGPDIYEILSIIDINVGKKMLEILAKQGKIPCT